MKLEKYLTEGEKYLDNYYNIHYKVILKIKADYFEEGEKIGYKYLKTIKTKGKDKVIDIDAEYSESL